jgi:hypothetical protein
MSSPDELEPPSPTKADLVHSTARAIVGLVPFVGSPALEFFNNVIAPPLERRREKWMGEVAEAVRKLQEERGVKVEDLSGNEAFVTAVMQATQIAGRVHEQEKIDALRNAVLNSALPHAPDDALQQMFLGWVERFTVWHLRALAVFGDPEGWFAARKLTFPLFRPGSPDRLLRAAYPELKHYEDLPELIIQSLRTEGLLTPAKPFGLVSVGSTDEARTTTIGNQFLRFVTEPKPVK